MFENLDDPQPPTPAPIDAVTARGRKLRMHRRMIAGALVAFVLAGTIATAAALQGNGHGKVVVSNKPSTTTVSATTAPATTSTTTAPETTTTGVASILSVPATSTTTSTQPPHDPNDLSMVTVTWPSNSYPTSEGCPTVDPCHNVFAFDAGTSVPVTYTLTNTGPWTVEVGDCGANSEVDLWTKPATSAWGPYSAGIWPQPYPARGADEAPLVCAGVGRILTPGSSDTRTEILYAGYRNQYGELMPAPPGFTSFQPSFLPQCAQPCDWNAPHSLAITIDPPGAPHQVFTVVVKTLRPKAPTGGSAPVEVTYSNPLGFTVRMPLWGPCWTVKSGPATVDCTRARPEVVIRAFATVDLVGTIWARKGFVASGAPLAAGRYKIDLGDLQGTQYALGGEFPYLTVTP